jgi:hypothetical protein
MPKLPELGLRWTVERGPHRRRARVAEDALDSSRGIRGTVPGVTFDFREQR